ncbi:MAG: hypothetical protein N2559_13090 [Anaerolineae bacterium]|nr:hypothetical protein [Anaerolineae bacterium]
MVYPVSLPAKLMRDLQMIAARGGKQPEELIRQAVQDFVRQEIVAADERARSQQLHARIKAHLRRRNPALQRRLSPRALEKEMDRLSAKIARGLPFTTWQQADAFMRGKDRYDSLR